VPTIDKFWHYFLLMRHMKKFEEQQNILEEEQDTSTWQADDNKTCDQTGIGKASYGDCYAEIAD
jgi:hypothetical protein